jgi:hypothetical protein
MYYVLKAIADQRAAEMRLAAAEHRRAVEASGGASHSRVRGGGRLSRLLRGRRSRQIELIWPDGVCSVVPESPADHARPMAGSRR